jgi:hypothetical protein
MRVAHEPGNLDVERATAAADALPHRIAAEIKLLRERLVDD